MFIAELVPLFIFSALRFASFSAAFLACSDYCSAFALGGAILLAPGFFFWKPACVDVLTLCANRQDGRRTFVEG